MPSLNKRVYRRVGIKPQCPDNALHIAERFGVSPLAARVLAARGFSADDCLARFLSPSLRDGLPAPEGLKNLRQACTLIAEIVDAGKSVAIACDFDVDGLSGGSQLYHFLGRLGVTVGIFVPDRFTDGYGLNAKMIRDMAAQGFGLLVCIDFGTTNVAELTLAKELGLQTVVIDHHHVGGALPPCDVFINPQQPDCGFADGVLCASGLTWYLLAGLRRAIARAEGVDVREYLDLACLGTICDMVPLKGPNRVIAKRGLEVLQHTKRPGLMALKDVSGVKQQVTGTDIAFGIGPRLNAAGRLVHGGLVVDLLTTDDTLRARKRADRLNRLNAERQDIEQLVRKQAMARIEGLQSLPTGLVVWDEKFHTGVIGIVAQRLVESYYRPAAVMGMDEPGVFKGSVRGISGFSVVETLASLSDLLLKFGGHTSAGGFSLPAAHVERFAEAFNEQCTRTVSSDLLVPYAEADAEVNLDEISPGVVEELSSFAPFGLGNPAPLLLVRDVQIREVQVLKDSHLRLRLYQGRRSMKAVFWRVPEHPALVEGAKAHVAFRPDLNSWNGTVELQAVVQAAEAA